MGRWGGCLLEQHNLQPTVTVASDLSDLLATVIPAASCHLAG
jgi:hypothetical protein